MSVAKNEKPGAVQRAKKLYRGVVNEMKKVHWPGKKELVAYTTVVVVSVFITGVAIWIIDSGVSFVMSMIIK